MKKSNTLKILLPLLLVSSSAFVVFIIKSDLFIKNSSTDQSSSQNNFLNDQDNTTIDLQKLSIISNRCRGCGRCLQLDPEHFDMNGRVATVISSTNLDSPNLKLAINNCPTRAIILE